MDRRAFLKASGAGVITIGAVAGGLLAAPQRRTSPLEIPAPIARAKSVFNVNGKLYDVEYEARTTLWEVISERIGLTGTVTSCNRGTCGVCTVLVDDVPQYSCHTLALEAAGKRIFTIEGLGDEAKMHPLQEVAYRYDAAGCGYCVSGWMMAAKRLLDVNKNPTEQQVKQAVEGVLCKCGAYEQRVHAIMDAAKVLRGEATL